MSGLPRSGSTLLMNILAQHPEIHTTPTSGCCALLNGIISGWDTIPEHRADKNSSTPEVLKNVLSSVLYSYHNTDKTYIVDKCRAWGHNIEMIEHIIGKKAKIIIPVRDISEILASFEALYRKTSPIKSTMKGFQNVEQRIDHWMSNAGEVGSALNVVRDIFQRGLQNRVCIVEFEALVNNPERVMKQLWNFLGLDYPEHNFQNIINKTLEDDDVYGYVDLHTIRPIIEPVSKKAEFILGPVLTNKYSGLEFWKPIK